MFFFQVWNANYGIFLARMLKAYKKRMLDHTKLDYLCHEEQESSSSPSSCLIFGVVMAPPVAGLIVWNHSQNKWADIFLQVMGMSSKILYRKLELFIGQRIHFFIYWHFDVHRRGCVRIWLGIVGIILFTDGDRILFYLLFLLSIKGFQELLCRYTILSTKCVYMGTRAVVIMSQTLLWRGLIAAGPFPSFCAMAPRNLCAKSTRHTWPVIS